MRVTFFQLVRYGIVGVLSNGVSYLIYLTITSVGMEHKLAMTLLYAAGVAQTFFFNKQWSFRYKGINELVFLRYCLSYAVGYLINLLVLFVLVDQLGYKHEIVQGIMVLILAIMLFSLQKLWVFRSTKKLPAVIGPHS